MKVKEYALKKLKSTECGVRLIEDERYRVISKAVIGLIFNLIFAFYNGILGVLSVSLIFLASAIYYLLLSAMRFWAVVLNRKRSGESDRKAAAAIGIMLMLLGAFFQIMVTVSMKYKTAAVYGTIPMITIATYTFAKITAAAVRHRKDTSNFFRAVNAVRYSEIAVSVLTMQQSMLVSFGDGSAPSSVILNACTGAGVCFFIFLLGIITLRNNRKEKPNGKIKNRQGGGKGCRGDNRNL